jgi:hypothetical protein
MYGTRLLRKLNSLLNHIEEVSEILVSSCQSNDVVPHPNHQNWAPCFIVAAVSVLPGGVYFGDDLFLLGDEVWPVLFVPFDPTPPHFDDLLLLEFPGN